MPEPDRTPSAPDSPLLRAENERLIERVAELELELERARARTSGAEATERETAADALRERERQLILSRTMLAEAQAIAHIGSWEVDQRDFTTHWSDEIYRILGLDPRTEPPSYATFMELVHPDDRERVDEACRDAVTRGVDYEITHRMRLRDGTVKHVHQSYAAAFDREGKQIRAFGTVQDVTEQRLREEALERALEEQRVLLREIHHRVKNNLQIICSLLYFQARSAANDEAQLQFEDCRARVKAMGMVHEALLSHDDVRTIDFSAYLSKITSALRESYRPATAGVVFRVEAASIGLDIQQAVPCGLIVNELVTNALKYAFAGRKQGSIGIVFADEGEYVRLTIADDGVGCPSGMDPFTSETLGLRLVRTLAKQVDAELSFELGDGVSTTLRFKR